MKFLLDEKRRMELQIMTKKFFQTLALGSFLLASLSSTIYASTPSIEEGSAGVEVDSIIFPFNTMSENETTTTGLKKLTPDEQATLLDWIRNRDMSLKAPLKTTVAQVKDSGKTLELANGQIFSINSSGKKKVAQWSENSSVEVYETTKSNSYMVKNTQTGDMVKAKVSSSKK